MKISCAVFFTLIPALAWSEQDTVVNHLLNEPHVFTATLSTGFIDDYRHNYSLPEGFVKNNTSGFAPFYLKLEYGFGNHISLAGNFSYDGFNYNYAQKYIGNNGLFTRYRTNYTKIFSEGIIAYYHWGWLISAKQVDPFIGIGISLNNIGNSAYPQGDSTIKKTNHTVTPYFKAGARYYISNVFSLFGDVGYDHHSLFSIGFSYMFMKKGHHPVAQEGQVPYITDSVADNHNFTIHHDSTEIIQSHVSNNTDTLMPFKGPAHNRELPINNEYVVRHQPSLADDAHLIDSSKKRQPDFKKDIIHFETGKTVPTKSSLPALKDAVEKLNEHPAMVIYLYGYTDITGSAAINKKISRQRAEAVKKYLTRMGVNPDRLICKGRGSRSPIASNHTRAGRAKNRRVELKIKNNKR